MEEGLNLAILASLNLKKLRKGAKEDLVTQAANKVNIDEWWALDEFMLPRHQKALERAPKIQRKVALRGDLGRCLLILVHHYPGISVFLGHCLWRTMLVWQHGFFQWVNDFCGQATEPVTCLGQIGNLRKFTRSHLPAKFMKARMPLAFGPNLMEIDNEYKDDDGNPMVFPDFNTIARVHEFLTGLIICGQVDTLDIFCTELQVNLRDDWEKKDVSPSRSLLQALYWSETPMLQLVLRHGALEDWDDTQQPSENPIALKRMLKELDNKYLDKCNGVQVRDFLTGKQQTNSHSPSPNEKKIAETSTTEAANSSPLKAQGSEDAGIPQSLQAPSLEKYLRVSSVTNVDEIKVNNVALVALLKQRETALENLHAAQKNLQERQSGTPLKA